MFCYISQSNITWYLTHHCMDWLRIYKSEFRLTKDIPYLTLTGVSVVRIWEKIDPIIKAPHCTAESSTDVSFYVSCLLGVQNPVFALVPKLQNISYSSYFYDGLPYRGNYWVSVSIWETWWHHQMETFSASLAFVWGIHRWPVNSPHKGQWRGALMFSLICAWINDWVNSRQAGDLIRHRAHFDITVMKWPSCNGSSL